MWECTCLSWVLRNFFDDISNRQCTQNRQQKQKEYRHLRKKIRTHTRRRHWGRCRLGKIRFKSFWWRADSGVERVISSAEYNVLTPACCANPRLINLQIWVVINTSDQRISCCDLHMWKSALKCGDILRSLCLKTADRLLYICDRAGWRLSWWKQTDIILSLLPCDGGFKCCVCCSFHGTLHKLIGPLLVGGTCFCFVHRTLGRRRRYRSTNTWLRHNEISTNAWGNPEVETLRKEDSTLQNIMIIKIVSY